MRRLKMTKSKNREIGRLIVQKYPRYGLRHLTPEKRRSLLEAALKYSMDDHFPKWHKTLVGHYKTDISDQLTTKAERDATKEADNKAMLAAMKEFMRESITE